MKKWILRFTFLLIFIENIIFVLIVLDRIQKGTDLQPLFPLLNQVFLVLGIVLNLLLTALLIIDFRQPFLAEFVDRLTRNKYWFWSLAFLLGLVIIESGQDLLFLAADMPETYYPRFLYESIHILYWTLLLSLQLILLLFIFRSLKQPRERISIDEIKWIIPAAISLILFLTVVVTGSGFIPKSSKIAQAVGYFTVPNTPIPMLQLIILWLVVSLIFLGLRLLKKRWGFEIKGVSFDILVLVLLWGISFLAWSKFPLQADNYNEAPRAPNYQYNVLSDSMYYEIQAQRLLVGEGFADDVQHSLYGYLLGGFHLLGGDHFQDIYLYQVALLALTPFLLYKLASLVSSCFAGWTLAGLFIIRGYNSLVLSDTITLSTVHDLMTETVTLLGVVLFFFVLFSWLKDDKKRLNKLYLAGSLVGLLMLVRVELMSLLGVIMLLLLYTYWNQWWIWIKRSMILVAAVLLLTLPWMTRNWMKTGVFYLDKGNFFQRTVQVYLSRLSAGDGESKPAVSAQGYDGEMISLSLIEKIGRHAKNNLVGSFLYLSPNYQPLGGLDNFLKIMPEKGKLTVDRDGLFSESYLTGYIKILPYWRSSWDGGLESRSILPLFLIWALIVAGFWQLWKKDRLVAITPILGLVIHSLTYAVFSRSGGRFIQVVDWIPLFYLSIGIGAGNARIYRLFVPFSSDMENPAQEASPNPYTYSRNLPPLNWTTWVGIVLVLVFGISMPIAESLIKPRYTKEKLDLRWSEIGDLAPAITTSDLDGGGDGVLVYGKALYPGFYNAGESVLDDRGGRVPEASAARLDFYLVGMENIWVSIPLGGSPDSFPHGSDVIIKGRITRNSEDFLQEGLHPYILADQIILLDGKTQDSYVVLTAAPAIEIDVE